MRDIPDDLPPLLAGMIRRASRCDDDPLSPALPGAYWPFKPLRDKIVQIHLDPVEQTIVAARAFRAGVNEGACPVQIPPHAKAGTPEAEMVVQALGLDGAHAGGGSFSSWAREVCMGYETAWPVRRRFPMPEGWKSYLPKRRSAKVSERLSLLFTQQEKDELYRRARADGHRTRTNYLRALLLGRSPRMDPRSVPKLHKERERLLFFQPYTVPRPTWQDFTYRPAVRDALPYHAAQGRLAFHRGFPRSAGPVYSGRDLWRWGWEQEALTCGVSKKVWPFLFEGAHLTPTARFNCALREETLLTKWSKEQNETFLSTDDVASYLDRHRSESRN